MTKKRDVTLTKSEALKESWKNRKDFLNEEVGRGTLHNVWRSKVFTKKGKKIGFPNEWSTFKGFKEMVGVGHEKGKILIRLDQSKPYGLNNFFWCDKGQESYLSCRQLEYNGQVKYLFEWSKEFDLNYQGVRIRYYRYNSPEEILFGKRAGAKKVVRSLKDLEDRKFEHAITAKLNAYRIRDYKRRLEFNISRDFLIDAIRNKTCHYCDTPQKIGLDRIDNNKGHTEDNEVPCCHRCNIARGNNFSVEEFLEIGKTIKKIDNDRARKSIGTK